MDITERKRAEQERERLRQLEVELAHMNRVSLMESWLRPWLTRSSSRLPRR